LLRDSDRSLNQNHRGQRVQNGMFRSLNHFVRQFWFGRFIPNPAELVHGRPRALQRRLILVALKC
jgi:hypothetical protein